MWKEKIKNTYPKEIVSYASSHQILAQYMHEHIHSQNREFRFHNSPFFINSRFIINLYSKVSKAWTGGSGWYINFQNTKGSSPEMIQMETLIK